MNKNKKPGIALSFEADPVGTLVGLLRQPVEALVDLVALREHFDYKTITDAMTDAMSNPALAERYMGIAWDEEVEALGYLPQKALILLAIPAVLNTHAGLLHPLSRKLSNDYVSSEPLERLDNYLFKGMDVYRANDAFGLGDKLKDTFIERLKNCREAVRSISAERLDDSPKISRAEDFRQAWNDYATDSSWYRKSISLDFGNDPVGKTIFSHILRAGPDSKHGWAYPTALKQVAEPRLGIKHDEYLARIDSLFSCKNVEGLHDPIYAKTLGKVYVQLYERLTMSQPKSKETQFANQWVLSAIREFHRLFFVPENAFVVNMRENPEAYANTLDAVLRLIKQPKSAQNLGIMAEFVSVMTGDGALFKTGHGTMAHSLVQLANTPVELLRAPERRYDEIASYLNDLFAGTRNMDKIGQAFDMVENSRQAQLFTRIWPEAVKGRKNLWLQDQRMGHDLGL